MTLFCSLSLAGAAAFFGLLIIWAAWPYLPRPPVGEHPLDQALDEIDHTARQRWHETERTPV